MHDDTGLIFIQSFDLRCQCVPDSISVLEQIENMVYHSNEPEVRVALPTMLTVSPDCGNSVQMKFTYTLKM